MVREIRLVCPDFGTCKNCGNLLIMLKVRGLHEKQDNLMAACVQCDVVQVNPAPHV